MVLAIAAARELAEGKAVATVVMMMALVPVMITMVMLMVIVRGKAKGVVATAERLVRTLKITSSPLTHACCCEEIPWPLSLAPPGVGKIQTWISHLSDTDRCEINSGFYIWLVFGEREREER